MKRLAQSILTGTLASASKITGSLEEIVRNAAGLEEIYSEEIFQDRFNYPTSIAGGLRQGGDVFVNSVFHGFSGLVGGPANGFQKDGLPGVVTGTIKGLVGFVAAPVTGALGAVSVVTESVRQSAQFRNTGRPVGKRRVERRVSKIIYMEISQFRYQSSEMICQILEDDWTSELPSRYKWNIAS